MRVFRRHDVAKVRTVATPGAAPVTLDIVHIDLYFFFDVDVVVLNVEVGCHDLPLSQAHELLYRFGRAYPGGWDEQGQPTHSLAGVEWLAADGTVLSSSDAQRRDLFLAHVCEHRAPRIASHWSFILQPLVSDHSSELGPLRYQQIEYYRMPLMAYLAVDRPKTLTRADFARLALVTGSPQGESEAMPYADGFLNDFE